MERDYTADLSYIAERIREARELNGWSQEEFADRAEISRSTLYRIETGKSFPIDVFLKILDITGAVPAELLPRRLQEKGNLPAGYYLLNAKNKEVVIDTMTTLIHGLLMMR